MYFRQKENNPTQRILDARKKAEQKYSPNKKNISANIDINSTYVGRVIKVETF